MVSISKNDGQNSVVMLTSLLHEIVQRKDYNYLRMVAMGREISPFLENGNGDTLFDMARVAGNKEALPIFLGNIDMQLSMNAALKPLQDFINTSPRHRPILPSAVAYPSSKKVR